ncbi:hypothetical protein PUN28_018953 [Cardiocondyla obscurior]|uniref:Uncharacterized protein n=1 Tax=Cardiocondyla obscurior TaxID=286306 RepID=A0AAW2ECQ6_9HYME
MYEVPLAPRWFHNIDLIFIVFEDALRDRFVTDTRDVIDCVKCPRKKLPDGVKLVDDAGGIKIVASGEEKKKKRKKKKKKGSNESEKGLGGQHGTRTKERKKERRKVKAHPHAATQKLSKLSRFRRGGCTALRNVTLRITSIPGVIASGRELIKKEKKKRKKKEKRERKKK